MRSQKETPVKISELKPGMDNVTVRVRVLEAEAPRVIETRRGPRTISEAVVGDETGRVKLTLWGRAAGTLSEGEAVEIQGAWTTNYRGNVVLNVGGRGGIRRLDDSEAPQPEEVPEETPKASWQRRGRRRLGEFQRRQRY
ncbi:OB-fold nucleic acid binding domain-containing protein [Hyperthermus butylicus]|uniref:Conserved archaeal protein n=1 Tax=Hyperthermus butylicus (strain DSM 5456 / JCM 9403 / PLM1-5) TaxID=415426 RepID=A2BL18_HYPBU|nr:OB-fold nucleic acid binding domain-containing protein [Hyperthermus butylicus]ABM80679.1 conserved archaeal protein [Hyperthermus butylicus DSM 5456]